jgi:hypothetical protein
VGLVVGSGRSDWQARPPPRRKRSRPEARHASALAVGVEEDGLSVTPHIVIHPGFRLISSEVNRACCKLWSYHRGTGARRRRRPCRRGVSTSRGRRRSPCIDHRSYSSRNTRTYTRLCSLRHPRNLPSRRLRPSHYSSPSRTGRRQRSPHRSSRSRSWRSDTGRSNCPRRSWSKTGCCSRNRCRRTVPLYRCVGKTALVGNSNIPSSLPRSDSHLSCPSSLRTQG